MVHKIIDYVGDDEISLKDKVITAALAVGLIGVAACTITGKIVSTNLVATLIAKWKGAATLAKLSSQITATGWKSAIVAGTALGTKVMEFVRTKSIGSEDDEYGYGR